MIFVVKGHTFKTTGIVPVRLNSTCHMCSYGGSYPQIFICCLGFIFLIVQELVLFHLMEFQLIQNNLTVL